MQTIILPGYSLKNKDWAEQVKQELGSETRVVYWPHWENPETKTDWEQLASELAAKNTEEVNIVAKSVGTLVAMLLLRNGVKIKKLVLCGVPVIDFQEGDEKLFDALKGFPSENILCIQNENDNHGSFAEVEKFLHSINPQIKIVSKPRDDHEYYYSEDFKQFLAP